MDGLIHFCLVYVLKMTGLDRLNKMFKRNISQILSVYLCFNIGVYMYLQYKCCKILKCVCAAKLLESAKLKKVNKSNSLEPKVLPTFPVICLCFHYPKLIAGYISFLSNHHSTLNLSFHNHYSTLNQR